MAESIRRISLTLFSLAGLIAVITLVASFAVSCPVGTSCLGAVFSYNEMIETTSLTSGNSTVATVDESSDVSDFFLLNNIIQSISIYLLIVATLVLIVLEIKELHYLKELSLRRRRKT